MTVPEASVDKYNCSIFWQDNIGGSGKSFVVLFISETLMPESVTQF